jgi:DnaK suppressor protein
MSKDTLELEKALRNRLEHKQKILEAGGEQALSHSQEDLDRIHRALTRLKTMGFGDCIACGRPILKERLDIYPEAERCTPCQELHEEKLN